MVETRGGRRFAAFFFVAAFLVLLFGRWLAPVNHVALSVAAPFAAAISGVANGTGDVFSGIFEGPRLRAENNAYRHQINTLLKENITLRQAGHENKILRRM